MKINQHNRYQDEKMNSIMITNGIRSLIQLYASELNFHELLLESIIEHINWDYLENILMKQLELQPKSAVQESNYAYFQSLKQMFEQQKDDSF